MLAADAPTPPALHNPPGDTPNSPAPSRAPLSALSNHHDALASGPASPAESPKRKSSFSGAANGKSARDILCRLQPPEVFAAAALPHLLESLLVLLCPAAAFPANNFPGEANQGQRLQLLASGLLAHLAQAAPLAAGSPASLAALYNNIEQQVRLVAVNACAAQQLREVLAEVFAAVWDQLQAGPEAGEPGKEAAKADAEQARDEDEDQAMPPAKTLSLAENQDGDVTMGDPGSSSSSSRGIGQRSRSLPSIDCQAQQRRDALFTNVKQHMTAKRSLQRWAQALPEMLAGATMQDTLAFQQLFLRLVQTMISHLVRYRVQVVLEAMNGGNQAAAGAAPSSKAAASTASSPLKNMLLSADTYSLVKTIAHELVLSDYVSLKAYVDQRSVSLVVSSAPSTPRANSPSPDIPDQHIAHRGLAPSSAGAPALGLVSGEQPRSELQRRRSMLALLESVITNVPSSSSSSTSRWSLEELKREAVLDVVVLRFFHMLERCCVGPALRGVTQFQRPLPDAATIVRLALGQTSVISAWEAWMAKSGQPHLKEASERAYMIAAFAHRYYTLRVSHHQRNSQRQ